MSDGTRSQRRAARIHAHTRLAAFALCEAAEAGTAGDALVAAAFGEIHQAALATVGRLSAKAA